MRPMVFLDRDGVLIEEVQSDNKCTDSPDKVKLLPSAAEAVKLLNDNNLGPIIITNQGGIALGYIDEDQYHRVHNHMLFLIQKESGGHVLETYYCPHHPTVKSCTCRKPQPGMFLRAGNDWGIDLAKSFYIGDRETDVQAAINAKCTPITIASNPFGVHWSEWEVKTNLMFLDVLKAVKSILLKTLYKPVEAKRGRKVPTRP